METETDSTVVISIRDGQIAAIYGLDPAVRVIIADYSENADYNAEVYGEEVYLDDITSAPHCERTKEIIQAYDEL